MSHATLTGAELHQAPNFWQDTDPAITFVTKYKDTWFKETTKAWVYRNPTNTGWLPILVPSSDYALPSGSTWSDFVSAYNAASSGDTIYWPNETIVQTDYLQIVKNIHVLGTGPASKLITGAGIVSGPQFILGNNTNAQPLTDFEWSGIAIEQDRAFTQRAYVWQLTGGITNIRIHDVAYSQLTCDVYTVLEQSGDANTRAENMKFYDCTVDEWWESVFNLHAGNCRNTYLINHICNVSNGNPNLSISRPYGAILQIEEPDYPSNSENIHIHGNQFISTLAGADFTNSVGYRVQYEDGNYRYHRVYVTNNLFDGWYNGTSWTDLRSGIAGNAHHYYNANTLQNCGSASVPILHVVAATLAGQDYLFIGDNDLIKITGAQTALQIDNASANIVQLPANRVT